MKMWDIKICIIQLTMLRGKFTAPNSYIRKKEMSQIKDLYSPFRKNKKFDIVPGGASGRRRPSRVLCSGVGRELGGGSGGGGLRGCGGSGNREVVRTASGVPRGLYLGVAPLGAGSWSLALSNVVSLPKLSSVFKLLGVLSDVREIDFIRSF